MINFNTLYKVSYGLYVVTSGDKNYGNGFISNTFFQVTADPPKFASCCNKDNFTAEIIEKHGCFSVSVLHRSTDSDIFGRFGYKSGRDLNKLESMDLKYGETGVPVVLNDAAAYLECKVIEKFDVGTHWLFIAELVDAQILDDSLEPITYSYYRDVKKAVAPKNAPTYIDKSKLKEKAKKAAGTIWKCPGCGYIYDESVEKVKFEDLPDDWQCPVCGMPKSEFYKDD